jgi:two-component system cell cycle response regulator DivK
MMVQVLMVDDNEDSRRIVRDLLAAVGYEMVEAVSGPGGVAAAEAHVPDLILMDVQLPEFDGYEATRRIKANPVLRHIPIIAVTSYAMRDDEITAYTAGCAGYVSKPFSPRVLLATIHNVLP